jgi:hypothetical protein
VRYLSGVLTLEILNPGNREEGKIRSSGELAIAQNQNPQKSRLSLSVVSCQGRGKREQGTGNREEGTGKREVVRSQESGVRSQLSVVREK